MTRIEAMRLALEAVWSGADLADAECVLDHLEDQGWMVTLTPAARRSQEERGAVDELPLASTTRLPKGRTA